MLDFLENMEPAVAPGVSGEGTLAIADGLLGPVWMFGMIVTALWAIGTGYTLARKN